MHGWIKDRVYHKHEKESDMLKMANGAWTISLDEIYEKNLDKIVYYTDKADYSISLNDAYTKGFIREFKGEKKLVVPLRYWKIHEKVKITA